MSNSAREMNWKYLWLVLFTTAALALDVKGQYYKISGIVTDSTKQPLALANVQVKERSIGLLTKEDGSYEFQLERGKYDMLISMVGFKPKVVTLNITNEDITENIVMELDAASNLGEVVIKAKIRDRAEEIIRNVIKNKEHIQMVGEYSVNMYVKALQQDSIKKKGKPDDLPVGDVDYDAISMAEVSLKFDKGSGDQMKEERLGVKKNGHIESLFYLTATDGDFNIYNNLLKAPNVSRIPFISPISYSGLAAYRFKTVKIDRTGPKRVYTISVKPRLLSNATIEGELTIVDSFWVVTKAEFRLPSTHLPEYDFFEVLQQYSKINDSAWMLSRQQFNYYQKTKGGKRYGQTTVAYSSYDLNKKFRRGYFGNEVSVTSIEAYQKDSVFWNTVRKEPLSKLEGLYTRYQDSMYKVRTSDVYLDSMDAVLNKITWSKMLIFGQIFNDHRKERMWVLPPITSVFQPFQFGGSRVQLAASYKKTFPSRKDLAVTGIVSYGFRNKDVNGSISFERKYNPFNRGFYSITVGREFQNFFPGDAWINMLKRSNIYLNNSIEVGHGLEILNGLFITNHFEIALRRSVAGYKINDKVDSLFGDILEDNKPVPFEPYNALYYKVRLQYTPGQKYLREPKEKIIIGSKWPTFYVQWRKGIPDILDSDIDFDYLEFGIQQKIKMGPLGALTYTVKTGDFPNKKDLRLVDYQYQRKGDPLFFQMPHKVFQALDSTFPVFNRYYQGNFVQEFNGSLISKIPFMSKLKLQEIAGTGFLIAPERDLRYGEVFAGIEKVFNSPINPLSKLKIGIYVVASVANKFNNPVQFKIGITSWDRFKNRWR
ncbi:MAG TPA: DUF5686 and carboxypeptidase regulatory-like domain-containing protein [Chitinophagaceae bacterium]